MLRKVSIAIYAGGYSLVAYSTPDEEVSNEHYDDNSLVALNHQRWQLNQAPFSELVEGNRWDELGLSARLVEALDRAAVASSKLARRMDDRRYDPLFSGFTLTVIPGRIDIKLGFNQSLMGCQVSDVRCYYEWDENRQMLPLRGEQGDLAAIPESFLHDIKEACYGRYGLLARQLERELNVNDYEPVDAMRWA